MRLLKFALPLIAFLGVAVFLALGLNNDPSVVPSVLIDKPVPEFKLPLLEDDQVKVAASDFLGKVWLLNVWASWCAACKVEHPVLLDMASQGILLVGLNYKDAKSDAGAWLASYQNPYQQVIVDRDGRVGIDFGVYGVPETFLIDHLGHIRYKHIGPVSPEDAEYLLSLYFKLQAQT